MLLDVVAWFTKLSQVAVPFLALIALIFALLFGLRFLLNRRYGEDPEAQFRLQLINLALALSGVLAIIMALPVNPSLKGQLLSLIGILLSASIALSSTTFLSNAMAGVMLRVVGGFRMGDFLRVEDHFGRVSERGLFHTEIQGEDRDLTTLPNMYLVTHPFKVVRTSGTIVGIDLSLGYDIPRSEVRKILVRAAETLGLEEPFVQIRQAGDFSITYRVAGLLKEVKKLISARSKLWGAAIDELHKAGVEIVSPTFMNTRAQPPGSQFIPKTSRSRRTNLGESDGADQRAFDKAEEAESLEELTHQRHALKGEIEELNRQLRDTTDDAIWKKLDLRRDEAKAERARLGVILEASKEREVEP